MLRRSRLPLLYALLAGVVLACQSGQVPTQSPTPPPTPTATPTTAPTDVPTTEPTDVPTPEPTDAPTTTPTAAAFPLTLTDDEGTNVELVEEPERVVSLTPATTELLFALGEGDKLVGRGEFDDYPPEATELPAVASFTGVEIEAVVNLEPDLVLAGGNFFTPPDDVARLRDLDIPVLVLYAADLDGVLADIELVGEAIGATEAAETMTDGIQAQIDEVSTTVAQLEQPRVFYEIGYQPEIYGPAPDSFIEDMVVLAGGEAITTGDPVLFSIPLEQLVTQDPEVIVLGDAAYEPRVCPADVAAREGWDGMTAVVNGDVRPVNDIIVTRPGPRIGDGLTDLALAIHPDAALEPPADSGLGYCDAS